MATLAQKNDYKWFKENFSSLYKKYGVGYVVVKDRKVLGAYDSFIEGLREAEKSEERGTFIVQQLAANREDVMLKVAPSVSVMSGGAFA